MREESWRPSTRGLRRSAPIRARSRPRRPQGLSVATRPVAIFRFNRTEGPAYLAEWLDAQKIRWQLVPLDEGVPVPADPRAFSGIAMMGGPMSAYDKLPWIAPLSALLRAAA